jgi:hypothetical protein
MHFLKTIAATLIMVMVCTGLVVAQQQQQQPQQPELLSPEDISDEELLTFVQASDAIQPIQQEAQQDMQEAVEDEGIEWQRFQQIMMAMQNPQMADQMDLTQEEEQSIQAVQPKLEEIEIKAYDEITSEIAEQGIDVERYQAIFMSLQQHPELMERLEALLEDDEE